MADAKTRAQNILRALPLTQKQRDLYERGAAAMDEATLERTTSKLESAFSRAPETLAAARELLLENAARERALQSFSPDQITANASKLERPVPKLEQKRETFREWSTSFCSFCGTQLPRGLTLCPACGGDTGQSASVAAEALTGGMTDTVAAMLAYVTVIPAILFLVLEPYNKNRFIRFHAFQSIFFTVAWIVLGIALSVVGTIPALNWATRFLWPVVGLGGLIVWVVLILKAHQGQMFKLPVIGDMAERQGSIV